MMSETIVNKIAQSQLQIFDLEKYYVPGDRVTFDLKDGLLENLILKEADFRTFIKDHDWFAFNNKHVSVICSVDVIVPTWAYMLVAIALQPFAKTIFFGSLDEMEKYLFFKSLNCVDWSTYENAKVVIKGCVKVQVPVSAYVEVANRLRAVASSVMYGEPCSTVPLFKRKPAH